MPVPNTFANATATIPLSQLDANFATTITLGNTAIQLGNTVSTLNNMTLANVTISSGNVTVTNVSATNANVTTANVTTANIGTEIVTTSQTLNYGTANGVVYLNTSKVATTGTALVFDGTNLGVGTSSPGVNLQVEGAGASSIRATFKNTNSGTGECLVTFADKDSTNNNHVRIGSTGNNLVFYAGNAERARFNTTGALVLAGGTTTANGIGITFPATQSASSDANTLDDYEEGTWTPVLGGDGGQSGQSYTARNGRYTKVGNICFVEFDIELSNKGTITGSANISGLPFTCANTGDISQGGGSITYFSNLGVSVVSIIPGPQPNQTYLYPRYLTAAAANITVGTAGSTFWLNNTRLVGMCWYQVN